MGNHYFGFLRTFPEEPAKLPVTLGIMMLEAKIIVPKELNIKGVKKALSLNEYVKIYLNCFVSRLILYQRYEI